MSDRQPFDPEDSDWGRQVDQRHRDNIMRFQLVDGRLAELKSQLDEVKQDTGETIVVLRAIKTSGLFLKWFVGIAAGIAVIFGAILAIIHGKSP